MRQALILGCSHASGNELSGPGNNDKFGLENSYPALLAKLMGYQPTNLSITGGSNDAMFRVGEQTHMHDIVIACWTGYNRTEVWDGQTWQPLSPGGLTTTVEDYRQQWLIHRTDEESGRLNKLKNILALNSIRKVINIDSFWPVEFNWPGHIYWPVSEPFIDWAKANGYAHTVFGHYELKAHQDFAEYVFKIISALPKSVYTE